VQLTSTTPLRKRLRLSFFALLVLVPIGLGAADAFARSRPAAKQGFRIVTVNVDTRPFQVAESLRGLEPDIVLMQETAVSCEMAARALGFAFLDGSDQCMLSRWPLVETPVAWPGPWQPPQIANVRPPGGELTLVNARLAIPEAVAALATLGHQWYSERQRQDQYPALRKLIGSATPAIVCGDFNAFPFEVDLGARFRDAWTRPAYGATFPARLPAARIDQCWATSELSLKTAWTQAVPSDHRALVVELAFGR
jgi:endonuclease/exonuclease/phosphatase (EEP) superfamily protein YafD